MKIVISPLQKETATFVSDFLSAPMEFHPDIEISFDFGYGSQYDGSAFSLHLTDKEVLPILNLIKKHASPNLKSHLQSLNLCPALLNHIL